MLTGDMARFTGDEKYHRSSDFFGCGHSPSQWNPCDDRFQLLFRIGERAQPLLIERRHNFGGNDSIHADAVRQKLHGPLTSHGEDRALRSHIARSPSLARDRCLRTDADNGSAGALQVWQSIMRHVVVMQQITLQRGNELIWTAFFKSDTIIHAGVVNQRIDSTKLLKSLLDSGEASLSRIQLRHNRIAVAMALS